MNIFFIFALIVALINSIFLSYRLVEALKTYKCFKNKENSVASAFKKWSFALGTLAFFWLFAVIIIGLNTEVRIIYSLSGYVLIFELLIDLFDGDKSDDFEKSFRLNRNCLFLSLFFFVVFIVFVLLAVFVKI